MKVLVLGAPWCQSCKNLMKSIEGTSFPGFEIEYVDLEERPEVGNAFNPRSLPTIAVPDKGISRPGITTKRQLEEYLKGL